MEYFVSGIAVAVVTAGLAYLCQHYIVLRKDSLATWLRRATLAIGAASLAFFCMGALRATDAFQIVPSPSAGASSQPPSQGKAQMKRSQLVAGGDG
jgi:hypothetical protein